MAILMVLLLLSLTVGLCYTAMRTQATAAMVQRNSDRRASARQAAITGLTMAIKKMSRTDWAGVDASLNGSINTNDSFLVTYTTGDPRLASSDADYPYRVTLLSTGYSADPDQPQAIAIYRVRAVVRLIPRALSDEPTDWTTMMAYTVYQWAFGSFTMTAPARIEGPVRVQATLDFDWDYDWMGNPRDNYHDGLHDMQQAGRGDYRPFSGPITLDKSWQFFWDTVNVLTNDLGVTVNNASNRTISGMTFPYSLSTYRLYPGGKQYSVPQLPNSLQATAYQADPATNPAGLFFCPGSLTVNDDTTVCGTIVTPLGSGGRVYIAGKRIKLQAMNLPPLQGTTDAVQLPVAMVGDSFQVGPDADISITGLISAYYNFSVSADNHLDINMMYQGKLIAQNIYFNPRSDWNNKTAYWWSNQYYAFHAQESLPNGYKYFPEWLLKYQSLDYRPKLIIKPDAGSIRYHWYNPQNAIYVPLPADGGLRWDLLDWTENL